MLRDALTLAMLPGVTPALIDKVTEAGLNPLDLLHLKSNDLAEALKLENFKVNSLFSDVDLLQAGERAKREEELIRKHNIRPLFYGSKDYPRLLAQTFDAPLVLYILGDFDFNSLRSVSVVGTRKCSAYGLKFTENFIEGLAENCQSAPAIISGLAYGVDAAAHKAALKTGCPTVAVVAHGLHMVYPAQNRNLAAEIIHSGGAVVSEYPFGTQPFRKRFLERNRIVAGISEATVVVESGIKGGALSTANLCFDYGRELFAVPGRVTDELSLGCNELIRKLKAKLLSSHAEFIDSMQWETIGTKQKQKNNNLFPELDGEAKPVYELLATRKIPMSVDEISNLTAVPVTRLMIVLSEMEFEGIVNRLPGNRYDLL